MEGQIGFVPASPRCPHCDGVVGPDGKTPKRYVRFKDAEVYMAGPPKPRVPSLLDRCIVILKQVRGVVGVDTLIADIEAAEVERRKGEKC